MSAMDLPAPIQLEDIDDWARIPRRLPEVPAPPCRLGEDPEVLKDWIYGISPIETTAITALERTMRDMIRRNASRTDTGKGWIAYNGHSMAGKTTAAVTASLRIHDDCLAAGLSQTSGYHAAHRPVLYVTTHGRSHASLLKSMLRCAGVAYSKGVTAAESQDQLRETLPQMGCRACVVDDGHHLRREGSSRTLTDDLKQTIDVLPVTFVFVGAGLEYSALLRTTDSGVDEYSSALQLRRRMTALNVHAFKSTRDDANRFQLRMGAMIKTIDAIHGLDTTAMRDNNFQINLLTHSDGLTGMGFRLIREVACIAIDEERSPTATDLDLAVQQVTLQAEDQMGAIQC